ncbi:uncharacterized protein EV422DRAFT_548041 [Fimicolochytrium jonesii]|uniref:uncharacterized protein n=1 Tax=Fimicolochytrium jonesii TaxID=1396493 RepID=UPI0022FDB8F6|nr:uncharacterized protein EV422DRAFT_548041 [Fimicolochytrium jonesii]KAI8815797.1 hypothetical protein EV422DRAFT_548041 [Fimicolochytrium jonesii]
MLQRKIDELQSSLTTQQSRYTAIQAQLRNLERERDNHATQITHLQSRCTRAQKVAAHLERQYREARPNVKIDYLMISGNHGGGPTGVDSEPSTQLLAALLPRD